MNKVEIEKTDIIPQNEVRDLLSRELQRRQERNGAYSLRAFARQLQISPSFLCEIMKGKKSMRETTSNRIREMIKTLL